jgi:hypothetical protein
MDLQSKGTAPVVIQKCIVDLKGEGVQFMKQPKIKIFGNVHKVMQIEFNKVGSIEKIVYQVGEDVNKSVFRGDTIINQSLTSERKIQKPTQHPYHDYSYAPDLERLLVTT